MSASSVAGSPHSAGVGGREPGGLERGGSEHPVQSPGLPPPALRLSTPTPAGPTSRRDTSMSTAKLVMWLHWQLTWLSLRKTTSQPRADQPPVPLTLWEGGRVRRQEGGVHWGLCPQPWGTGQCRLTGSSGSRRHRWVWCAPPSPAAGTAP